MNIQSKTFNTTQIECIVKNLLERNKTLIVILGPTASGKTSYSINFAKNIIDQGRGVEIINADSRQLYRYLDIGTAKITKKEMGEIPHHLIDVLDPNEEISVGWYQNTALKIISEIQARGNIPILVGGSMLYISSITDGLSMAPAPSQKLRNILINEYDLDDGITLYNRLKEVDPNTAKKLNKNNKPRLIRAIEIFELTKKPKSKFFKETELRPRKNKIKNNNIFIIGMDIPRNDLIIRINQRTTEMFKNGWIEEVKELLEKGYKYEDPGMKSCGYREIISAINSNEPIIQKTLEEIISAKIRQYARRQITWWKGDERIEWVKSSSYNLG